MDEEEIGREDIVELEETSIVDSTNWVVVRQIGRGAYGQVYHVIHKEDDREGAMKIEALGAEEHMLRIELAVLKDFGATPDACMQAHDYGANETFSFIVMTLGGPDLTRLSEAGSFNDSTLVRVALRTMIAIKSLHEIGYIHRDVKPCNFASSLDGMKAIHLIDFGMTRKYAVKPDNGQWILRRKRNHVSFRGTVRYCSVNVHYSKEQGRVDDLWSWLYMVVEFRTPLPWRKTVHQDQVKWKKEDTSDKDLCGTDALMSQFLPFATHLRSLQFFDRPDYLMIASVLEKIMKDREFKLLDEYDWEGKQDGNETADKINAIYEKYNIDRPKRKGDRRKSSPVEEDNEWKVVHKALANKPTDVPGGEQYAEQRGKKAGGVNGQSMMCSVMGPTPTNNGGSNDQASHIQPLMPIAKPPAPTAPTKPATPTVGAKAPPQTGSGKVPTPAETQPVEAVKAAVDAGKPPVQTGSGGKKLPAQPGSGRKQTAQTPTGRHSLVSVGNPQKKAKP